jgi:hypothetical protein
MLCMGPAPGRAARDRCRLTWCRSPGQPAIAGPPPLLTLPLPTHKTPPCLQDALPNDLRERGAVAWRVHLGGSGCRPPAPCAWACCDLLGSTFGQPLAFPVCAGPGESQSRACLPRASGCVCSGWWRCLALVGQQAVEVDSSARAECLSICYMRPLEAARCTPPTGAPKTLWVLS